LDGEDIKQCPLTLITKETIIFTKLYTHYKNGFLPATGGILEQTVQFLLAMEVIDKAVQDNREKEEERKKRLG